MEHNVNREAVSKLIDRLNQRGNVLNAAAAWGFDGDGHLMLKAAEYLAQAIEGNT
jgi:hypothetical protein